MQLAVRKNLEPVYRAIEQLYVPGSTRLVASSLAFGARVAQEKLDAPLVSVHLSPVLFRSEFEGPRLPRLMLHLGPRWFKRFQWWFADRTVIDLIVDATSQQTLADEKLPCRPEDNDFEARTKAVLRRYIVERCIYGVDLDPLAIELCRLSLWIETLDPRLPFTFLDHKIKCGNSLVGTWFDQFMHYPAMAWMREGGDKSHTNGVHFKKEAWTKQISSRLGDVKNKLIDFIDDDQRFVGIGKHLMVYFGHYLLFQLFASTGTVEFPLVALDVARSKIALGNDTRSLRFARTRRPS
jgi:hypothetical protein